MLEQNAVENENVHRSTEVAPVLHRPSMGVKKKKKFIQNERRDV